MTDIKIQHDRPDIFVYDKKKNEIILIEPINSVDMKKTNKYDLLIISYL